MAIQEKMLLRQHIILRHTPAVSSCSKGQAPLALKGPLTWSCLHLPCHSKTATLFSNVLQMLPEQANLWVQDSLRQSVS